MENKEDEIALVEFGDSDALYVNGKLIIYDDYLSPASILLSLGIKFNQFQGTYEDEIPKALEDVSVIS